MNRLVEAGRESERGEESFLFSSSSSPSSEERRAKRGKKMTLKVFFFSDVEEKKKITSQRLSLSLEKRERFLPHLLFASTHDTRQHAANVASHRNSLPRCRHPSQGPRPATWSSRRSPWSPASNRLLRRRGRPEAPARRASPGAAAALAQRARLARA